MANIDPSTLRQTPLFQLLDNDELSVLAGQLEHQQFWAGQMIFSEGEAGGKMYVVQSGRVEVFIKDAGGEHVRLDTIETGDMFGELSLLDNEPRSANAKALEETHLIVVDRHDLEMLFKSHLHAAFDVMAILGKRIRQADRLVRERVIARNVNEEMGKPSNFGERLSDFLTSIAGSIRFVYFNFLWFASWIILNTRIIPGLEPFDPFPFGLLTMIVSLEAIFLSLFVLISQNRQAARDKVRNDIEYDVNIKAELEIKDLHDKLDDLQEMLLSHLKRIDTNVEQTVKLQTQTGNIPAVNSTGGQEG
jgi:CRP/FNR family transcriptional regulator, cyclic AMP receptor protein